MEKDLSMLNDDQLEQIAAGKSWELYPPRNDGICPRCKVTKLEIRPIYSQIPYCVNNWPYCRRCGVGFMVGGDGSLTELPLFTQNGKLFLKLF